jgi:hypothetical protein
MPGISQLVASAIEGNFRPEKSPKSKGETETAFFAGHLNRPCPVSLPSCRFSGSGAGWLIAEFDTPGTALFPQRKRNPDPHLNTFRKQTSSKLDDRE